MINTNDISLKTMELLPQVVVAELRASISDLRRVTGVDSRSFELQMRPEERYQSMKSYVEEHPDTKKLIHYLRGQYSFIFNFEQACSKSRETHTNAVVAQETQAIPDEVLLELLEKAKQELTDLVRDYERARIVQ